MEEQKCELVSTSRPTNWPTDRNKIPDSIDLFIIQNISAIYSDIKDGWDMSSNNSPIILTMCDMIVRKEGNPKLTNKLTEWEGFKSIIGEYIELAVPLKTPEQLDQEIGRGGLQFETRNT